MLWSCSANAVSRVNDWRAIRVHRHGRKLHGLTCRIVRELQTSPICCALETGRSFMLSSADFGEPGLSALAEGTSTLRVLNRQSAFVYRLTDPSMRGSDFCGSSQSEVLISIRLRALKSRGFGCGWMLHPMAVFPLHICVPRLSGIDNIDRNTASTKSKSLSISTGFRHLNLNSAAYNLPTHRNCDASGQLDVLSLQATAL